MPAVKAATKNPVCECGRIKDFRRKGHNHETYLTCQKCFNEKQYRRIRERKTKICEIHGEEKVLHSNGSLRCVSCRRKQNNAIYAARRGVQWDDPLNDIQGPLRPLEKFPSDPIAMRALAIRLEWQHTRCVVYRKKSRKDVRA